MNISPLKARWELRKTVGIHGGCKSQTLHPLGFLLCTEHPGVEKGRGRGLWAVELTIRFTAEKRKQFLIETSPFWFRGFLGVPRMTLFVPLKKNTTNQKTQQLEQKNTHLNLQTLC